MQKLLSRIKPRKQFILVIVALLVIFCVFLLSAFNAPIADDWGFFTSSSKHNFLSYMNLTYVAHTARFSQWALLWIGFRIFGMTFVQIYPFVSFAALIAITALILIRSGLAKSPRKAFLFSTLMSVAFLCSCPSPLDSFLWLDSNAAHFSSIIFLLLIILEIISIYRETSKKRIIIRFIALLIICFSAQFFSELTSIINIAFLGLFCVLLFIAKGKIPKAKLLIKICIPSLLVLVAGLLILYYSPARIARSSYSNSSFSLLTIKESLKTFKSFFGHLPVIAYAFIVFSAFSLPICLKTTILNKRGILLSFLILFATTFCSFLVICYAQGFVVPRTLTMTAFGFSLSVVYLLACIIGLIKKKAPNFSSFGFYISFLVLLILSAIFIPPYIEKIATRHFLSKQRDSEVITQIENNADPVRVFELPILVYGTAEDFYYYEDPETGEKLPIWVADQYIDYIRGNHDKPNYTLEKIDYYSKK